MLVRDFVQPATVLGDHATVGDVATVASGSAYVRLGTAWHVVRAESLIGYPTSRRLIDVPLWAIEPVSADEDISVVLSGQTVPETVPVVDGGAVIGCVDRRRVLEALSAVARPEDLGVLLLTRLTPMLLHDLANSLTLVEIAFEVDAIRSEIGQAGRIALAQAKAVLKRARDLGGGVDEGEPVAVDVAAILDDLSPMLERTAAPARLELAVTAGLPRVRAYPRTIARAALNLVLNAREALPDGGTIRVSAAPSAGGVELRVDDDGAGLPTDATPLFEPGFSTKNGGSRGLGLPAVASALGRIGATIEATDSPLGGAGFRIELRRADG